VALPRPSYAEELRVPAHRSFFRRTLAARARPVEAPLDPVHEYLVDQANLRGFFGAWSNRADRGQLDPALALEDIVVGLLQPHAPADLRALKLVLRILQSGWIDCRRLLLLARRERALPLLAWLLDLVPEPERTAPVAELLRRLRDNPPRDPRRPRFRYDPQRLVRRPA